MNGWLFLNYIYITKYYAAFSVTNGRDVVLLLWLCFFVESAICWFIEVWSVNDKFLQKKFVKYLERNEKVPTFALAKRKTAVPQWRSSFERDAPKEILKKTCKKICAVQNFDLTLHSQLEKTRREKQKRVHWNNAIRYKTKEEGGSPPSSVMNGRRSVLRSADSREKINKNITTTESLILAQDER